MQVLEPLFIYLIDLSFYLSNDICFVYLCWNFLQLFRKVFSDHLQNFILSVIIVDLLLSTNLYQFQRRDDIISLFYKCSQSFLEPEFKE